MFRALIVLVVLVNVVYSFSGVMTNSRRMSLSMSDVPAVAEPEFVPPPPAPKPVIMAKWFPFGMKAPKVLDGSLAG